MILVIYQLKYYSFLSFFFSVIEQEAILEVLTTSLSL